MTSGEKFPFPATTGIIAFTGIIYIALVTAFLGHYDVNGTILHWLGNHRYYTLDNQWWRLVSSLFLHGPMFTLIVNFHMLMFLGLYLEPLIGGWKLVLVYILSGVVSSAFALCLIENSFIVGPYGAICGLAGIYIALMISRTAELRQWIAVVWALIIYIVICMVLIEVRMWITLLSGLITGFIIGLAYFPVHEMGSGSKGHVKAVSMMIFFVVLPVVLLMLLLPNKVMIYEQKMVIFKEVEKKAENTFSNTNRQQGKALLRVVKEDCIEGWKKNYELTQSLSNMKLPDPYRYRNKKAGEYCRMQLQKSRLLLRSLQDDKYHYKRAMEEYEVQLKYLRIAMTE